MDVQGSRVTAYRRLAWNETDAAGHNHFSAAVRWLEETEHTLYRALGLGLEFIDRIPRVSLGLDYRRRLYFAEELRIELGVKRVGTSSCTFAFAVFNAAGDEAVVGEYVVVHVQATDEGSTPWPPQTKAALVRGDHFVAREELAIAETDS